MTNQPTFNRRRVLELSGVGTGLAIAGCTGQLDDNDLEGDRGELADGERRATIGIQLDPQEQQQLQQRQSEIQQQFEQGELDEAEAEAEFQELEERQQELVNDAFETVVSEFEAFDITIEDTLDSGAMLVAGPATDLIDALDTDAVQAMFAEAQFEQAQQAEQQPAPDEGEQQPEPEE